MAPLTKAISKSPIKMLLIGESGSGKTGALASLAAAGFNLRILDIDKGSEILLNLLTQSDSIYVKKDPLCAERVDIVQVSDPMRNINGVLAAQDSIGWPKAMKLLENWSDGETQLGKITSWGLQDVLVIDSLTGLSKLAYNFYLKMNGKLGQQLSGYESQRAIGSTQGYIKDLLDLLYNDAVGCNIIVISHITAVSEAGGMPQVEGGEYKNIPTAYPSSIGRALSPLISRWFNNAVVAHKVVQGSRSVHKIFTQSQFIGGQNISAKTAAPLRVKPFYGIENGLAELFSDLRSS